MDMEKIIRAIPMMSNRELSETMHAVANEVEARMQRPDVGEYPTDGDGHRLPW